MRECRAPPRGGAGAPGWNILEKGGGRERVWVDMGYFGDGEFISGGVGAVEHDGSDKN